MVPGVVLPMITYTKGNLLESQCEAVVNTVNTVGVMGKGIALMFKEAYPDNYKEYKKACKDGSVQIGFNLASLIYELFCKKKRFARLLCPH